MKGIKPALLTPGDPAGIGPEISLRAWSEGQRNIVLMGGIDHLSAVAQACDLDISFAAFTANTSLSDDICSVWELNWPVMPKAGQPSPENASVIIDAIKQAAERVKQEQFSSVITNPIAKSVLYQHGFEFPGHTEFLAALDGPGRFPVMMLANQSLRVVPLTIHIPLSAVERAISADLFNKTIQVLETALYHYFSCSSPRIAIAGLNPHAGEDGHIGRFESDMLIPLIQAHNAQKAVLSGPFPADSLFHRERQASYDAVLCMYHDQALIPIKTIDFYKTVNITVGLSFIRTSPDHGTAFDRAADFNSNPDSLINAIQTAHQMAESNLNRSK